MGLIDIERIGQPRIHARACDSFNVDGNVAETIAFEANAEVTISSEPRVAFEVSIQIDQSVVERVQSSDTYVGGSVNRPVERASNEIDPVVVSVPIRVGTGL